MEITISRRWWCRYVCPGGALYSLIGWLRPVRVKLNKNNCTSCGACNRSCHLGLKPMQDLMGSECDNCGLCISSCRDDALAYGLQLKTRVKPAVHRPAQKLAGAAVWLVLLAGAWIGVAQAHHILGIPHYAYDERYPQIPILTYRVEAGRHNVEVTGYPGIPQPGQQCFVNVYINRPETNEPFPDGVRLEVLRDRLIGKDPVVYGPIDAELQEAVYKFYPQFESEANYILRISYEDEGLPWIIDLPMVVGEPGSPWALLGGIGIGLAIFFVVIRALRIKLQRRAALEAGPPPVPVVSSRQIPPTSGVAV